MSDIITRDDNGDLAVRTVAATEQATPSGYDDLYARTTDGKRALRVVGAGGGTGGGDVSSVNGKKGNVVLTGADINSTLTGTGEPVTTTVTEHLQTLKNDETELGNQVSNIQALIPSDASETNQLIPRADVEKTYLPLSGGKMSGPIQAAGTEGFAIKDNAGNIIMSFTGIRMTAYGSIAPFTESYELGRPAVKWRNVYTHKINNGADLTVPTEGGTLARLEDIPSGLPDQTGHTGFLQTDGTNATWTDKPAAIIREW